MWQILVISFAAYAVTKACLAAMGIHSAIPYALALALGSVGLPFAICASWYSTRRIHPLIGFGTGVALLCGMGLMGWSLWAVWVCGAIFLIFRKRDRLTRNAVVETLCLVFGIAAFLGTVFNLNYAIAALAHDRLRDALLIKMDRAIYDALLAKHSYSGVFPLVDGFGYKVFECAYIFFAVELVTVAFLMRREANRFFGVMAAVYGLGLLLFYIYPTVGPQTYAPESFVGHAGTYMVKLSRGEYLEFRALLAGKTVSGCGYFIALPSLHVAVSLLLQGFLRSFPRLFATLLPINVAMAFSTFVLGQHYLADVMAGAMLAFLLWPLTRRPSESLEREPQRRYEPLCALIPN